MTERVPLAVVGAGPAGLAAAITAAEAGLAVTLIDSYPRPGGQYFKQLPESFRGDEDHLPEHRQAQAMFQRLAGAKVRLLTDTLVWGAFPVGQAGGWLLTLYGPDVPPRLQAEALILATGAYDRPIPFPGWTLPGVMTAGAVQALLKSQRVLPGRRILLAGSGPLQLAVAAQLVQAGAQVVGLLEGAAVSWQMFRHIPALWGQWARLRESWSYRRILQRAGVPLRFGWAVVEARGQEQVQAAVIARLDGDWQPLPRPRQTIAVDTIVTGYGFRPANQLSRLLGCRYDFRPERGGYVPRRDEGMQTSLSGLYIVGDGAGIGGAELARIEGRIAGWSVAHRLGQLDQKTVQVAIARQQPALARERRFARMLADLFTPGPGLYRLATDDTLICRCEEVSLSEIRQAVAAGARSVNEVKGLTRAGMGNCQGRMCEALVARAIADEVDSPIPYLQRVEAAGCFSPRPPIHPLPLSVLAEAGG